MNERLLFPVLGMLMICIAGAVYLSVRTESAPETANAVRANDAAEPSGNLSTPQKTGFVTAVELADAQQAAPEMQKLDAAIDNFDFDNALLEARALLNHESVAVRLEVVSALDWIGVPALFDLAGLMTDNDGQVAAAAEKAFWNNLEDLEDPQAKVELLSIPFESKDATLRAEAAGQLGFVAPLHSFPVLLTGLKDESPQVRERVRENLWFLSGGESFQTHDQWADWYAAHKQELAEEETQTASVPR